ncbi:hypothetical protein SAMN05443633_10630 [Chryseobacterium arachidis]|uniref:Uncharacterized protein n=1 Tax=Chryseobacterium arachidis TaxID=1416778 RepID=A0A1M5DWP2_9FLAO|nr:hypothetical protein [Chryseobacterium arachidis]SHF71350.1 hypothetical protein SAMN05443633_10630 [Chryseobacterium arachidis]
MKRKILNIFTGSAILTTIGFLMDGDAKEPNVFMRFIEFFGVMGILFFFGLSVYFSGKSVYKLVVSK